MRLGVRMKLLPRPDALLLRLVVRNIRLPQLVISLPLPDRMGIIWVLLFYLSISVNEVIVTKAEFKEAVSAIFYEHSVLAFSIFDNEI